MDTCSGDDISYQIPIATTVTFDGVQYENIYATTNSVITFGQPDPTYWAYPNTPSISLYSMDWFPGVSNTSGLDIYYSEGGFQLNLNMVPYGNYGAQPSTVNILVAITNTGGLAVSYSYQGPEYQNLRTGVRLHNGDIVSLEAWGATQVQAGSPTPTLAPEPIPEPSPTPTEAPITPEEQQEQVAEAAQLASEISNLNNLIASINGEEANDPEPEPTTDPEPSPEPTDETDLPEPDVEVDPEIITPDDPRFPDEAIPTPSEETNDLIKQLSDLTSKDTLTKLTPEQKVAVAQTLGIKPAEIAIIANLAKSNESVAEALATFSEKSAENANAPMPYTLADAITEVQADKFLADPIGALTNIDLEKVLSPSEWGKDMTDDQREKVQEVIIPVILVGNIVNSVMSLRRL